MRNRLSQCLRLETRSASFTASRFTSSKSPSPKSSKQWLETVQTNPRLQPRSKPALHQDLTSRKSRTNTLYHGNVQTSSPPNAESIDISYQEPKPQSKFSSRTTRAKETSITVSISSLLTHSLIRNHPPGTQNPTIPPKESSKTTPFPRSKPTKQQPSSFSKASQKFLNPLITSQNHKIISHIPLLKTCLTTYKLIERRTSLQFN